MRNITIVLLVVLALSACALADNVPSVAQQAPNTWVKRSPLPDGPPSPRLGYESSMGYIPGAGKLIRWGGHDPGGGGPQLSETWTFSLHDATWRFLTPNNNPPGNCCCRENVTDPTTGRFYRFSHPSFGHGWMWDRARWLREDSVWVFDPAANTWTNMRPGREPKLNVGKPAVYDPNHQIIWVYDTRLRAYDPHTNTWHVANEGTAVTGSDRPIGKRTYAAMALHPRHNKIVLFGDHYQSDPRTLVYDITRDEWTDMKPKVSPPWDRSCPTMVYDSANNIMICVVLGARHDVDSWAKRIADDPNATAEQKAAAQAETAKKHLETWTYELETNTWTKMEVAGGPSYFGTRDRLMVYIPELNIVALESRGKEQQIWTYRYRKGVSGHRRVAPPPNVRLTTEENAVKLTWDATPDVPDAKYRVFVGPHHPEPWKADFEPAHGGPPFAERSFTDKHAKRGPIHYYYVHTISPSLQAESDRSNVVRTQPRVIVDSRVDVLTADKVVYSWAKSSEPDVVGYVVERAVVVPVSVAQCVSTLKSYAADPPLAAMARKAIVGQFARLTEKPIIATEFTDAVDLTKHVQPHEQLWSALVAPRERGGPATRPEDDKGYDMTQPGCPLAIYAYRVRAVNRLGVESGPSPYQLTIPNEVEHLFTKEDGKDLQLRWQASPHAGVKGYLVYRLDGQYGKVSLLTRELIPARPGEKVVQFTDTTCEGKAHRYYVVAVDALGQHGLPSHGAWGFRPWGQVYRQFYAEDGWHQ